MHASPRRPPRLVLAAAVIAGLALLPMFVANPFWLSLLNFIGIYVVLGVGLTLLFGYADQFSFGHAGFYGIGAYASALLSIELGLPVWLTMFVFAPAIAGIIGYLLGKPILRLRGLSLGMGTLAFGLIMFVLFTQLTITGGSIGLAGIPPFSIGSLVLDTPGSYFWLVLVVALVAWTLSYNIGRSHVGRALRAIGANERAAAATGIDVAATKARVFAYSAALAGLAGALYAHYLTFISAASFTPAMSILAVLIVVIGGRTSIWGALLGAIFVALIPEITGASEVYAALMYGVVLTAMFILAPGGIIGLVERARSLVRSRRDRPTEAVSG